MTWYSRTNFKGNMWYVLTQGNFYRIKATRQITNFPISYCGPKLNLERGIMINKKSV